MSCTQWGTLTDICSQWGMGEEDLWHVCSGGRSVTHVPSEGWERRGGSQPCTQWGTPSDTCPQWGMGEEKRISAMYAVGDTHSHMFPVGDGGGEEDLSHVRSGGCSVTHVPSGEWWRRGGSQPCTQWGTLSDTCPQWGMGEEKRICVMYAVGDTHSHMFPVGDGGGEEDLSHVRSGGCSVTHVPSGEWWRRGGSQPCTQWGTLSDTCPHWGMVEERRISAMYAVGDAQ